MWIFNNTGSNFTTRNNKLLQGWLLCILFSEDYTVLMFFRELCYIIHQDCVSCCQCNPLHWF